VILTSDFLIVEDEFLIAETISEILTNIGCSKIRMVASVEEAVKEIEFSKPQIVLTDINLGREKTGIDLGNLLHTKYHIPFIYITSHSSPEILGKAKHTRPNAYIIKPFKNEDLLVAIELALFNSTDKTNTDLDSPELIVKEGRTMVQIDCDHIKFLESDSNYTTINLKDDKRRVVRIPLSELQEQLPNNQFLRIHKSYIVNRKYVNHIKTNSVVLDNIELPVGRSYQQNVVEFFK
jgi:DNA-binding LytR/AlgR family response regulator